MAAAFEFWHGVPRYPCLISIGMNRSGGLGIKKGPECIAASGPWNVLMTTAVLVPLRWTLSSGCGFFGFFFDAESTLYRYDELADLLSICKAQYGAVDSETTFSH